LASVNRQQNVEVGSPASSGGKGIYWIVTASAWGSTANFLLYDFMLKQFLGKN